MAETKFDLKGFLNDPKVQADKDGAVKFLQSKGIIDASGNLDQTKISDNTKVTASPTSPFTSGPIGSLPGIKQLNQFGIGLGSSILKAGIGLGQTFLKGANVIGNVLGTGKDQYNPEINAMESIKTNMIDKPYQAESASIPGKVGQVSGAAAPFMEGSGSGKAVEKVLEGAPKIVSKVASVIPGAVETGLKQFGFSGGDTKSAVQTGITDFVLRGTGKLISSTGEALYKAIIPTSEREAGLLQAYKAKVPFLQRVFGSTTAKPPTTAADTAFNQGLKGTESMLGIQAKRAATNLWDNLISPQLKGYAKKVNLTQFFDDMEQTIVKENPELSRQKSLLEGLSALKEDYKGVKEVTLEELQNFKKGWAEFVPDKVYKGKPIAGVFNEVKNVAAEKARSTIYGALGQDVKQAYIDYGNLQAVQDLGKKAMAGGKFKGGFGSFWSAMKDMTLTPVSTVGGRTLYRIGNSTFMGPAGAKVLNDLFTDSPTSVPALQSLIPTK